MLKDASRFCDGCGQKLPVASKLSEQTMPAEEARRYGVESQEQSKVTVDLCLQCRLIRSNLLKRGYA